MGTSDWTIPQAGGDDLDALSLDGAIDAYNFDIAF
jgi:hypothetical protein